MKNRIKQYLLAASMCVGLTACSDFFEPIPGVQFGLDETFASKQRTEEYLNNVYSYVREVTDAIHPNTYGGIFTEASLDGANRWNKTYAEWTNGSFNSASAQASEYFSKYYQAIAKASTFIQNVDKCTEAAASTRGKWKSEARALRAYYYFELLRLYGPIPLIGEDPIPLDASLEELIKERNSVDECVNFIATELQSAIDSGDLLQRAGKANLGRMDVATCMALKAKLYLYWASPLFNGNTDQASVKNKDGKQLFPQTEDNSKWTQARDAYERFMTFATGQGYKLTEVYTNGKLDPYASCRAAGEFFTTTWEAVDELIFVKLRDLYDYTYWVCPKFTDFQDTDVTGGGGYYTTQETVDLFFTKDGLTIEEDPGYDKFEGIPGANNFTSGRYYDPNNPSRLYFDADKSKVLKQWKDREPRFYANIRFHGEYCSFDDTKRTHNFLNEGKDGKPSHDSPIAGYQINKALTPSTRHGVAYPYKPGIIVRLAEKYLSYAEALNEYDPGNADIEKYMKLIRERAGLPALQSGLSQDAMRDAIHHERRVEFAFEGGMRYMDIRRWKEAEKVFETPISGMNTDGKTNTEYFKRTEIQKRVFLKKMYLWPIYQNYLDNNEKLVQNKYW